MRKQLKFFFRFILLFILVSCSANSFNSEDWKGNKNRSKQIGPLISSKILIGKTYDEVVKILGKQDFFFGMPDTVSINQEFSIQYLTGGTKWIDFERLLITFVSGKVIRTKKYYD